ncbi:MAG TPA: hypothetical protein DDW90_06805, partial [Cyanobacteria bacterium UBA9971]|nr:hypothetical protein [Cyanobacteria bacterium UBA9971]
IATNVAMQNAMKKRNPDAADNFDTTGSNISIFSAQVREAIRNQAAKCNDTSSQIVLKKGKNNEAVQSCSEVSAEIAALQSLTAWAGVASQEIASIPGISDSAISSINKNMGEAVNFGAATISNAASQANEALSKINTTQNKPIETVVKTVQNNINAVAQNAVSTAATAPAAQGTAVPTEQGGTTPVETTTAQPAATKAAAAPKVEAEIKTEGDKLDNPFVTEKTEKTETKDA